MEHNEFDYRDVAGKIIGEFITAISRHPKSALIFKAMDQESQALMAREMEKFLVEWCEPAVLFMWWQMRDFDPDYKAGRDPRPLDENDGTIAVERLARSYKQIIGKFYENDVELKFYINAEKELEAAMRIETAGETVQEVGMKWPHDWREAFKARWVPGWLLKYWPVKYDHAEIKAQAIYPKLKLPDEPVFLNMVAKMNGQVLDGS